MISSFQQKLLSVFDKKNNVLPKKKTYSLRNRIFQYFLLFLAAFLLFAMLLIYYFSDQLLQNSYRHIHETLALYSSQLEQDLSAVESSLFLLASEDTDVSLLGTMDYSKETPLHQIRVNRLLTNTLPYFSSVDGLFIYAERTDSFISSSRSTDSGWCNTYVKSLVRMQADADTENLPETSDWYFVSLSDGYYLVRIMKQRFCYTGAWARLETLTSTYTNMKEDQTELFYVNHKGNALTSGDWSSYRLSPADSLHDFVVFEDRDGQEYLQISIMPHFGSHYLMAFVPMEHIRSALDPVYRFIVILILLLLALEIFMFLRVNRFLARPALTIRQIASQVHDGSLPLGSELTGERCEEVLGIHNTLNALFDEISALKINVYEERLAKTEFELEYLKTQVAPHFLINCFSTIYSLSNTAGGQAMTQKMIQTLSDHLRYTLSTRNMVALSEELHYVKNYLELTQIRFPDCLSYEIDVADECMEASVFPLLLLMQTENTIKYNMIMGEQLSVKITGMLDETKDPPHLMLMHLDSGDGFTPEDLPWMNHFDLEKHKPVDGHGVGFYNVLKRLSLLYGESAQIRFSNEPGWGARIDFDLPYLHHGKDREPDQKQPIRTDSTQQTEEVRHEHTGR